VQNCQDELDFSKGWQWMEADCPNNTEYQVCSEADIQPGREPSVQQNSDRDSEGHIEQLFT